MIKVDHDYYFICEDEVSQVRAEDNKQMQKQQKSEVEAVGDVKTYLAAISDKIKSIKQLREKEKKEQLQNRMILEQLNNIGKKEEQEESTSAARIQIMIPQQVYQLEERLSKIENKLNNNEIFRQKVQRKGKLSERVKFLNSKIETLSNKSTDILISNIQKYYEGLDDKKEDSMKTLFLHEVSSNTKGLTDQIEVLTVYLDSLNKIQTKVKGMGSVKSIVENHEGVLAKRKQVRERIGRLSKHMSEKYEEVMKQIDSI